MTALLIIGLVAALGVIVGQAFKLRRYSYACSRGYQLAGRLLQMEDHEAGYLSRIERETDIVELLDLLSRPDEAAEPAVTGYGSDGMHDGIR